VLCGLGLITQLTKEDRKRLAAIAETLAEAKD
jgi:hypothetical protein